MSQRVGELPSSVTPNVQTSLSIEAWLRLAAASEGIELMLSWAEQLQLGELEKLALELGAARTAGVAELRAAIRDAPADTASG